MCPMAASKSNTDPLLSKLQSVTMTPGRENFIPHIRKQIVIFSRNSQFVTDRAIAELEAALLCFKQPSIMIPQQYVDELDAKSCKVDDVYDKGTINDIFIERFNASIRHSLRHCWKRNSLMDLNDIAFLAKYLLSIQERATSTPFNNRNNSTSGEPFNGNPWNRRNSANSVDAFTTSSFQCS